MRSFFRSCWSMLIVLFAVFFAFIATTSSASAQATRTWVSGVGDDANPCSRTAPCKTFAGAISKTAAGGEINVVDPGGFGAVTITKSISIIAQGPTAGVLVSGTNGIIINAGANDVVVLRGLDIDGTSTGLNGVRFIAGSALHIQNCIIRNFRGTAPDGSGIQFIPSAGAAELYVTDSSISFNGNSASNGGIQIKPTGSGSANVVLTRTSVENNGTGIITDASATSGQLTIMIRDSQTVGNTNAGLFSTKPGSASIRIMMDRSLAGNNATGIVSDGSGSVVVITGSTISGNNVGLSATNGGSIISYVNNFVAANLTSDGSTTGTLTPK